MQTFLLALVLLIGSVTAKSCLPVTRPVNLMFPQDLHQHPDYKMEWHWYVGNVRTSDNRWFGVEVAVLRNAGTKDSCNDPPLGHLYFVDFGLSDATNNVFYHSSTTLIGGVQVHGTTTNTPAVPMFIEGKNVFLLQQIGNAGSQQYHLQAWGKDNATKVDISIDLQLTSKLGNVSMAQNGYEYIGFPSGAGVAHYDQPWIDTTGTLSIGGKQEQVSGPLMLQHMWYTADGDKPTISGWHWYTAQLSNGWSIAFTHHTLNHSPPPVFASWAYGNILVPKSTGSTDLTNTYVNSTQLSIELQSPWISPHTNVTYWLHHIIRVPQFNMEMHFKPRIADNEMYTTKMFFDYLHYYEGGSDITGTIGGQSITGLGYTEMVGPGPAAP